MTNEFNQPPFNKGLLFLKINEDEICDWQILSSKIDAELDDLPCPGIPAKEIVVNINSALKTFKKINLW